MSISFTRESLEAYLKRLGALRENAEAALHKVNERLHSTVIYPGSFEAADRLRHIHSMRASEYEERLQRYVWAVEELEHSVRQRLDSWEEVDGDIATDFNHLTVDAAQLMNGSNDAFGARK